MSPTTFAETVRRHGPPLRPVSIETVQVNIGAQCNLACRHCHVESSPLRRERMDWPTMQLVLDAASRLGARTLDITGGAPELHPRFEDFVRAALQRELHVMVRTNLTVLLRPKLAHLLDLFREGHVHLIASLPCYLEENVDRQRGHGTYADSITVLRRLNALGYGREPGLELDLVYNPLGPTLPGSQGELEAAYKERLRAAFGIEFTRLYALANMPIGRFAHDLEHERPGALEAYETTLREAFNPGTLPGLMCRKQVHVGWDGSLNDCDFNFVLGMRVEAGVPRHVRDLAPEAMATRRIATAEHCFGCTAGHGSSCGGALA
jgi:radical SAM/Cys-rich protein